MSTEPREFEAGGPTWEVRAKCFDSLSANLAPGDVITSEWLAFTHDGARELAFKSMGASESRTFLDFGCGTGRHASRLARRGTRVIAVDIAPAMLERARCACEGLNVEFHLIDGVHIPVPDGSLDAIWTSGVLKYSLFCTTPRYHEISAEFYRVLKPNGYVFDLEMHTNVSSDTFTKTFLATGFRVESLSIVNVYKSSFQRLATGPLGHVFRKRWWATANIFWNIRFAIESAVRERMRDYLFIYRRI